MAEKSTHEKRVEAGRAGGLAPHECRGSECTHPSHGSSGSSGESTPENLLMRRESRQDGRAV